MKPELNLSGQTAIITGGGRGIGRAIVESFAEAGANVAVAARTEAEIREAAEAARRHDVKAIHVPTDITKASELETLVDRTVEELGHPTILVNNAAAGLRGTMLDRPMEDVDTMIDVNLRGVFLLSRLFARNFIEADLDQPGRIINLSSLYAHFGVPHRAVYSSTKAGVEGMTRSLATELAAYGITVNSVAPGRILTDRIADLKDSKSDGRMNPDEIPLGRLGRPEEVAWLCLFLASPLGGYITGEDIRIDGGVANTTAPYPVRPAAVKD